MHGMVKPHGSLAVRFEKKGGLSRPFGNYSGSYQQP
jgi:hypothetical protein